MNDFIALNFYYNSLQNTSITVLDDKKLMNKMNNYINDFLDKSYNEIHDSCEKQLKSL
jgi:hypothetical protein